MELTFRRTKWKEAALVLLISTLAFLSFFGKSYFSEDFKGMLGYELKDTLSQLMGHFRAAQQGSTLYWDPIYLQYTPRFPQVPLHSPITLLLVAAHKLFPFSNIKYFFGLLLAILALIQITCTYSMFIFLRYFGLGFFPSVLGGLCYSYNYQTFVFGIRHGYERISPLLLIPLCLVTFFKALDSSTSSIRRRMLVALTALLLGVALISNGDVKPTFYFCIFMVIAALFGRPFRMKNLVVLIVVFALAGGIFLVHALPTFYSLRETARGQESIASIMEFSLRPVKLLLTHISTDFTDRPDYPWENTAEFSISMMLLVILGIFHLHRHRMRTIFLVTLIICCLWIMGKYTPLAPIMGRLMKVLALRHPGRMVIMLYFCYAFLAAVGTHYLSPTGYNRIVVAGISLVPVSLLILLLVGSNSIPARYVVFAFLSYLVLFGITYGILDRKFIWLIALFFMLERTTVFSTLEESNVCDPTKYYTYDEIYRAHPRMDAILQDPDHRDYRAFFGIKDFPDLFSHNFYLNAYSDGARPIFPYFLLDEELRRVRDLQEVIFSNWANPMWDLLNVKYFVDLDRYFSYWDEEDISREGLDHLRIINERLRVNPGVEKELFVRYQAQLIKEDEIFLEGLRKDELDLKNIAFINSRNEKFIVIPCPEMEKGGEEIKVVKRKTDEIVAEIGVTREALVIFSEFWFFPWQAEVDGKETPLFRAYNVLMGTKVGPGQHRVRFYFNSRHWKFVLPFVVSYSLVIFLGGYILFCSCREKRDALMRT